MNNDNIIEIKNLTKTYLSGDDTLLILDNIDFSLKRRCFMSLSGESGSGKSTFLNIVGALDKGDSGEVFCCGLDLGRAGEREMARYRNRETGFIFQFHYLLKDFTALENVMMPGRILGRPYDELKEEAVSLLKSVGLDRREEHYPGQLSGGERQRVALARAMINSPDLILADEPTGSLDEKNSRVIEELLFSICREKNVSLVLVTHDERLADLAEERYRLHSGKLEKQ